MFKRNTTPIAKETQQPVQAVERITSVLGSGVIWHGSINGSGGVRIEGAFEGEIALRGMLVVGETGRVTCQNVRANTVIVAGAVRGNITTQKLEIRGTVEALNLSNPNAAALMTLARLAPQAAGEVRGESLRACVARLLRVVNCEAARAHAIAGGTESLRWCEGGRSDEYLQRRAAELLALLVSARRQGCGVLWG